MGVSNPNGGGSIPPGWTYVVDAGSQTGTYDLDCVNNRDVILKITLAASLVTVRPVNMVAGQSITILAKQDGIGLRGLTLSPTPKKVGGLALSLSLGAGAEDVMSVMSPDGTNLYANITAKAVA